MRLQSFLMEPPMTWMHTVASDLRARYYPLRKKKEAFSRFAIKVQPFRVYPEAKGNNYRLAVPIFFGRDMLVPESGNPR
jgi:hypothetical protein